MENNTPQGYLPFDAEIALKDPERVVTGIGIAMPQLTYDKENSPYCLTNKYAMWTITGKFHDDGTNSENDLFLLPEDQVKRYTEADLREAKIELATEFLNMAIEFYEVKDILTYIDNYITNLKNKKDGTDKS